MIDQISPSQLVFILKQLRSQEQPHVSGDNSLKEVIEELKNIDESAFNLKYPNHLLEIIDGEVVKLNLNQDGEYKNRIKDFKQYISGRWSAERENFQTKKGLVKILCELFVRSPSIDKGILEANFPPLKEDFNCFNGIVERLSLLDKSQDVLLEVLQQSHLGALQKCHNLYRNTIESAGSEVHIFNTLRQVLEGKHFQAYSFDIPSHHLAKILKDYPKMLHDGAKEIFDSLKKNDYKKELQEIAQRVLVSIKCTKEVRNKLSDAIGDKGLEIKEEEVEEIFNAINSAKEQFEKLFKEDLIGRYPFLKEIIEDIFSSKTVESESQDESESGYKLELNYQILSDLVRDKKISTIKTKFQAFPESSATNSTSAAPESDISIYSNSSNLAKRLKSENRSEMLNALIELYSLSKSGYTSCVLLAFKEEVVTAAKSLNKKFKAELELGDSFYSANHFMLQEYLGRYENAKNHPNFAELLNKSVDDLATLVSNEDLLFVVCNLSTEDAQSFIGKLDPQKIHDILFEDVSQAIANGVSAFSRNDLLKSLVLRPDFKELLQSLFDKLSTEHQELKIVLLLDFLTIARNNGAEDTSFIKSHLPNMDELALTGPIKNSIGSLVNTYLRNPKPITPDDIILKFIPTLSPDTQKNLLLVAAQSGHQEVVSVLLEEGADVNLTNAGGDTALMFAAESGHKEVVSALLAKGANTILT